VLLAQRLREAADAAPKVCGGVTVVVQMHLDFPAPTLNEAGKLFDMPRVVLFDRIEERMPRHPLVRVVQSIQYTRVLRTPSVHTAVGLRPGDVAVERLVVVRDCEHDVGAAIRPAFEQAARVLPNERRQPDLRIPR
jgi:hypothetical protein